MASLLDPDTNELCVDMPDHRSALVTAAHPDRRRTRAAPRSTPWPWQTRLEPPHILRRRGRTPAGADRQAPLGPAPSRRARSDRRSHPTAHRPVIWSTSSTPTQCTRDRSARGEANRGCNRRTPRHRIRHSSNHGDEAPVVSRDNTARAPVDLTRSPVIEVRPLCQRAIAIRSGPGGRFAPRVVDQFRSCRVHDR